MRVYQFDTILPLETLVSKYMNRRLWRENGATAINHLINLSFPSFTFTAVCRLCRFPFSTHIGLMIFYDIITP